MKRIAFGSAEAPPPPSKIVCVGRNYREHAAEMGGVAPEAEPLLFLKAPSALLLPGAGDIRMPPESQRVDYEGELALVIGKRIKSLAAGEVARGPRRNRLRQRRDGARPPEEGRPVRPRQVLRHVLPGRPRDRRRASIPSDLAIATRVNGDVRQSSRTSRVVFSPAFLVAYVSRMMTLLPGDLILTGTPAGIGPLAAGDVVEVEIEQVGVLRNRVSAG